MASRLLLFGAGGFLYFTVFKKIYINFLKNTPQKLSAGKTVKSNFLEQA